MERLQRVIASRGVSSRRSAEELIASGRVMVNGSVVTELGTRVNPVADEIRVDGRVLQPQRLRTMLLNKPAGYITTMSDERERRTVMDLVETRERLFPVGRLDRDTEGLLLLTNDGELANRIMHPRYQLAKEYHVLTSARPSDRTLQRIRDGVLIEGRLVVPDEVRLLRESREGVWVQLVIHEGFYHAVRRIMEAANISVIRLRRHRIGPISLRGLEQGESRDLTPGELAQIGEAVQMGREEPAPVAGASTGAPTAPQRKGRRAQERLRQVRAAAPQFVDRPAVEPEFAPDASDEDAAEIPVRERRRRPPLAERPDAWSARRPEAPPPFRSEIPGAPGNPRPFTPRADAPSGPRPDSPARTPRPAAAGPRPADPTRRPPADRPAPPTAGRPPARPSAPRRDAPAPSPVAAPPMVDRPSGARAGGPAEGRFETVGGQRFSEVRRSFRPERPDGAPPPSPRRAAGGRPERRPGGRPAGPRPQPGAPRHDDDRPRSPAGPPRRDTDRPRRDDDRPRRDEDRPRPRPSGPSAFRGAGPGDESADRPAGPRRPARQPQRPTERPATARTPLSVVGRTSRKVASDNPDEASSRIKRRSPHSHSHRGRKPKPVAPKANTTKGKYQKPPERKGNKRGRRR